MESAELSERMQQAIEAEADPRHVEMRRAAGTTREVIDRLVASTAPIDALERAAGHLEAALRELAAHPSGRMYEGFAETGLAGGAGTGGEAHVTEGHPKAFFDHSPVVGRANPLAPPLHLEVRDGMVRGHARFGSAYEGPPGSVHGGYVACAFDEVLGLAQALGGHPGMTGTLTIRYRRPTPLHVDLRFEAGLDRVEGRKLFCSGRVFAGDTLTAEAEGIFITVDFAKIAELMSSRDEGSSQ